MNHRNYAKSLICQNLFLIIGCRRRVGERKIKRSLPRISTDLDTRASRESCTCDLIFDVIHPRATLYFALQTTVKIFLPSHFRFIFILY